MSSDPYGSQDPSRSGSYEDYSQGYSPAAQPPQPTYGQPPYTQPTYGQPTQDPYGQPTYSPEPTYGQAPYTQPGYAQQQPPAYGQAYQAPAYGMAPYSAAVDSNPRPSVAMPQAIKLWLKNWKNFTGRASRSEFWWAYLGIILAEMAVGIVLVVIAVIIMALTNGSDAAVAISMLLYGVFGLFALAMLVPTLSLGIRRLHDSNQSGWMWLLGLVPYVGGIVVLILMAQPSNPAGARFDDRAQPLFGPEHL